jgi:hypothetical protein
MLTLINPVARAEPFDRPDWPFEPKFDGFQAAVDTVRGCFVHFPATPEALVVVDRCRSAMLARVSKGARLRSNGVLGEGQALYRAVVDADLEGTVAKHLADAYQPKHARYHKILNRTYSSVAAAPNGFASPMDERLPYFDRHKLNKGSHSACHPSC